MRGCVLGYGIATAALALLVVLALGGLKWIRERLRERETDYVRRRIRDLEKVPAWIAQMRGYGFSTYSEMEDEAAQRYETWETSTDNPDYPKARRELERLRSKLRSRGLEE